MNLSAMREFDAHGIHLQCEEAIRILDRERALQMDNIYLKAKKLLEGREAGRWPKIGNDREVTTEEVASFLAARPPMKPLAPVVALLRPYKRDRKALVELRDFTATWRGFSSGEMVTLSIETWGLVNRWRQASLKNLVYPDLPDLC